MYVKAAVLKFHLSGSFSLKDKRQIRKRLIERTKQKFNVSIAEVATQEIHQTLTIGFAIVSGDAGNATDIFEKILRYLGESEVAELVDIEEV